MYTMPRSFPQSQRLLAIVSALAFVLLLFFADASAQRRRRPSTAPQPQPQSAGANSNTQTAQQKPQKKNITPLRSGDTAEGSRITITSDAPLNDYSAYRSGDRYYVIIPEANAPRAQGGLRGRGFEDVQVQRRGNDAVLSFKLQPGTNARVQQRFNRLDVELTTPGGRTAALPTPTPKPATTPATQPTPQTATRPTPQTATTATPSATGASGQTTTPGLNQPGGNPTVVYAPTPDAAASPSISPEASPAASPAAEQIAQAQPPPGSQPATTSSAPEASATTLGAILRQNWLVILIAALVLLSLVMIVAARSRAQRTTETPARRVSRKERRAAKKATAELAEADTTPSVSVADALYKTSDSLKAKPLATATAVAPVDEAVAVEEEEKAAPVIEEEETKEVEAVAPAVDVERVDIEVKNVLAGESYDESIIGATDAGTRQLIATELLSALAARNVERRERARAAFIKHDYLDEATRNLRIADAPAERAAAARSLGYVKDKSATPHLVAALEDDAPEVRRAAVEALAELRDPAAVEPLQLLLARERDRKVSKNLIKRAIEASKAVEEEEETPTLTTSAPALTEVEAAEAVEAVEVPPVIGEAELPASAEAETPTLEAEVPAVEDEQPAALADVSSTEVAPELIAAGSVIIEEVDAEAEEAARREAEAEEAARLRAEEEERERAALEEQQRLEAEARRREEEEAQRIAAEEARRRAEEEAERARAEEEERLRLEAEAKRQAEAEARQRAEEEARRLAEEEKRKAEEEERLRAAEEARLIAEAQAAEERRQAEEAAARLKAEEDARKRAEEEARRRAAEEEAAARLDAKAIPVVEVEVIEETTETPAEAQPIESLFERNDGTTGGWVEVDVSESEISRHAAPVAEPLPEAEASKPEPETILTQPSLLEAETVAQETKEIELSDFAIVEEPVTEPASKEIDYAVTEKGIDTFDEFAAVPGAILRRLSSEEPTERAAAVADLARVGGDDSFREINAAFDDPAVEVRNAAARSLFHLGTDRAATFTRALRESPPERRRKIGAALASSGLASEAIGQLMGESREKTYDAFSLLFLMSKAGEVQPLMRAIEEHPNNEVRLAVVKLLALSGQQEILPAFRRLAVRGSLPTEVRSAVMEAIYQISSQSPTAA
jgi:HEAT repeat protein